MNMEEKQDAINLVMLNAVVQYIARGHAPSALPSKAMPCPLFLKPLRTLNSKRRENENSKGSEKAVIECETCECTRSKGIQEKKTKSRGMTRRTK